MSDPKSDALINEFYQWRWARLCGMAINELRDSTATVRRYREALDEVDARVTRAYLNGFVLGVATMFCVAMWTIH